jgi:putative ABC transport system permease protein
MGVRMYLFKLITRNLRRNLRRSILTGFTIALATFVYAVLAAVPGSMDRIVHDASATLRLIVMNRSLPFYGIPAHYCDEVRKMSGAAACVAIAGFPATYQDSRDQILAVGEGLQIANVFPDYDLDGSARRAFTLNRRGAFAGSVLMKKYGWHKGQLVTLRGVGPAHLELSFVLLGEMPSHRYPNVFAFRRDYLEAARKAAGAPNPDLAWNLVVRVERPDQVAPLIHQIDSTFRNSEFETRTLTESDALAGGLSMIGNLRGIVASLCAVVLLTVLLIAANSTAMMVRERMSEVGVMRTLGFGRGALAAMLFGECGAIGLGGGAIGAAAAWVVFSSGATMGSLSGLGALWVSPAIVAQAIAIAAAVGLLSGALPIVQALRITPAIALREVA